MNGKLNYRRIAYLVMKLVEEADCNDCRFFQNCDFTEMSCWYHHEEFVKSGGNTMDGYDVIRELSKIKSYTENVSDIDRRDKSIEKAKNAVRKHLIPQSVIPDDGTILSRGGASCPVCHAQMIYDRLAHEKRRYSFCFMCGQALDWGKFQ